MIPALFSIFIDYKCNFACAHCSVGSNPRRSFPMSDDVLERALMGIRQIPTARVVVFTGGESTLQKSRLLRGIRMAHEVGYVTRLVSNGWWAKSPELAEAWVAELKAAGLDELNTSYDDFHEPFAPPDIIPNLIRAGLRAGLRLGVGVIVDARARWNAERIKFFAAEALGMSVAELERQVVFLEDYPTPSGTGRLLQVEDIPEPVDKINIPCPAIVRTISIHPDGSVKVCCGQSMFEHSDLTIGNLLEVPLLELIEAARHNLMYWWIHMLEPKRILDRIGISGHYTSICHACQVLFTRYRDQAIQYLIEHRDEVLMKDVLMSDAIPLQLKAVAARREMLSDA